MTGSNFGKFSNAPKLARPVGGKTESPDQENGSIEERTSLFAAPPGAEEAARRHFITFGATRGTDGRSAKRTGRVVQFGTVVTLDFRQWLKATAKALGKTQAALLDDMRAAYIEKHGE